MRFLLAAVAITAIHAPSPAFAATCREPALRAELLQMYEADQAARHTTDWPQVARVDRRHTLHMHKVVDTFGWPGYALVGKDGAMAAWVLVQHADGDVRFQQRCLPLMAAAARKGQASKRNLAYLVDRVAVNTHRPQTYGTQFRDGPNGKPVPQPIGDVARVDQRRKAVGLEPLATYAAAMRRMAIKASDPALGEELVAMSADNQRALRLNHQDYASFATTRERTTRFLAIVAAKGWPDVQLVGNQGAQAAAALANNLPLGTDDFPVCVSGITKAHAAGLAEGSDVARLTDRWLNRQGKRQRYGTALTSVDGVILPTPIEDVTQVDERRAKLGLRPLAVELAEVRRLNRPPAR